MGRFKIRSRSVQTDSKYWMEYIDFIRRQSFILCSQRRIRKEKLYLPLSLIVK